MKISVSQSVQNEDDFSGFQDYEDQLSDRCESFQELFQLSDTDTRCQENDFLSEASYDFDENTNPDMTFSSPQRKGNKNQRKCPKDNQTFRRHVKKSPSKVGNSLKERKFQLDNVKKFGARFNCPSENSRNSENNLSNDSDDGHKNECSNNSIKSSCKKQIRPSVKRLCWNNEDMQKAMECVNKKEVTMRGAAKKYNVPYSTLKDRIRERVKHGTRPGVKTMLSSGEEDRLLKIIKYMVDCGFDVQRKDIRSKAHEILVMKNGNSLSIPGHNWLTGFLERHKGRNVEKMLNRIGDPNATLNRFFEVTSQVYAMMPSNEKPSSIYCMTYVQLPSLPKTSIILTASADGSLLPPYVIGKYDRNALQLMNQIYPSAMWTSADGSGIDKAIEEKHIQSWFRDLFLEKIKSTTGYNNAKIKALFVNMPTCNMAIKLIEESIEEQVHLINIPSGLTKDLHPIDNSLVDGIDKQVLKFLNHQHTDGYQENINSSSNSLQIAKALKTIFEKGEMFRKEIKENFKRMGLYPLKSYFSERDSGSNRKINSIETYGRKKSTIGNDENNNSSNSGFPTMRQTFQELSNFSLKRFADNTEAKSSLKRSSSALEHEHDNINNPCKYQKTSNNEVGNTRHSFSTNYDIRPNSGSSHENKNITIADFRNPDFISRAMASIMPDVQRNCGKYGSNFDQSIKKEYSSAGLNAGIQSNSKYSPFVNSTTSSMKNEKMSSMEMDTGIGYIKEEVIETCIVPLDEEFESQQLIEEVVIDDMAYCDHNFLVVQNTEPESGCDTQFQVEEHLNAEISSQSQIYIPHNDDSLPDLQNVAHNEQHLPINEEIIIFQGTPMKANQMVEVTMEIMINNHPAEIVKQVTLKEALGLSDNPALIKVFN